jgi:hypothetical protein
LFNNLKKLSGSGVQILRMEKISKRFEYSLKLYEISQMVDLNQKLIDGLSEHKYFKEEMKTVMVCH